MLHRLPLSVSLPAALVLALGSPCTARGQTPAFSRADYASHSGARAIATADFNRDGWPDTANANTGRDTVTILLNREAIGGGFSRAFDIAVGHGPFDIVTADVNRDGVADLVVANADDDTLSILLGDGTGHFTRTDIAAPGNPRGLTVADMNRDGTPDIIYTGFRINVVQILLGDGHGAFSKGTAFFGHAPEPQGIAAADFNHDGLPDLAVAYASSTGGLAVLMNHNSGALTARAAGGEANLNVVTTADFNRDGWMDVAAASTDAARLAVFHGSADGLRQAAVHLTGSSPRGIEAADLNNDGLVDLVAANRASDTVSVFVARSDAPGVFASARHFAAGPGSRDVTAADFNNDSLVDLATGNQDAAAVTILWNGTALVRSGLVFTVGEGIDDEFVGFETAVADFDRDGRLDRVTDSGRVTFGDGRRTQLAVAGFASRPGVMDLNGDGHLDLAFLDANDDRNVKMVFGDGRGGFGGLTSLMPWSSRTILTDMEVADLNRDGRADLLVSGYEIFDEGGSLFFMAGNGHGTFRAPVISPMEPSSFFAVADLNRDARLDVITSPFANGSFKVVVRSGDGTGRFTLTSEHPTPDHAADIVTADVNHDGRMDVIAPTFDSIHVMLGTPDGPGSPATIPASDYRVAVADMDGDGHLDIVGNSPTGIYFGVGDGTFAASQGFRPFGPRPLVADMNRDGVPDLVLGPGWGLLLGERNQVNRPPVADAGPDVTYSYAEVFNDDDENRIFVGNNGSLDPDLHLLAYEWRDAAGTRLGTNSRLQVPQFLPGTYELTLRVSDGRGGADEDRVVLTITPIKEIVLHALHDRASEGGNWMDVQDPTAASGFRKFNPDLGAPKVRTPVADPQDYFEVWFIADPTQEYKLWLRGKADRNHWANDSAWVQFEHSLAGSTPAYRIGTTSALPFNIEECANCGISAWGWEDDGWGAVDAHGTTIRFAQGGLQRLRIQTREDGVSIDQIVLSAETYKTTRPGAAKNDTTILPERQR